MSVGFADVSWTSGGTPVTSGVFTSAVEQKPDKTSGLSSFLTIKSSEWITDRVFTCKVSVGSKTSEKSIKKSDCSE
uniref:Immunoglobulin C1-set domain-containing protein n=1 Tax=Anguilla anguilla TaxID=7936 RepID=A0A0E9XZC3_ANGAN